MKHCIRFWFEWLINRYWWNVSIHFRYHVEHNLTPSLSFSIQPIRWSRWDLNALGHTHTHSTRYNWILETTLKNGRNELRRQQEFNYIFDSVRHYLIGIDYLVAGIGLARVQLDDKLAESCQSCLHISRFDGIAWLDLLVFEQRHRLLLGLCAC